MIVKDRSAWHWETPKLNGVLPVRYTSFITLKDNQIYFLDYIDFIWRWNQRWTIKTSLEDVCPSWSILCLGDQDSLFSPSLALSGHIFMTWMFHMARAWDFSFSSVPQAISPLSMPIISVCTELSHKLHLLIRPLHWDTQHLFLGFQKQLQKSDPLIFPSEICSALLFLLWVKDSTNHSAVEARNPSDHS